MKRRTFLGIPVPKDIQESLFAGLQPLRELYPHFRWVEKENYHITLSFFGILEESQITQLFEILSPLLESSSAFTLKSQDVRKAPFHHPRMLWEVFEKSAEFSDLVQNIEKSISEHISLPDYRKGHSAVPHITLARFDPKEVVNNALPTFTETIPVTTVRLFESVLSKEGSVYHPIREFSLRT